MEYVEVPEEIESYLRLIAIAERKIKSAKEERDSLIRLAFKHGVTYRQITKVVSLSNSTIWRIVNDK